MTEVLFAVGAGPGVVGVCEPATYPPEAAGIKAVASWDRVDVEGIVALSPGACFTVEGMQGPEALASLRRLGIPVVAYPMRTLSDIRACILDAGRRTGNGDRADLLAASFDAKVSAAGAGLPAGWERALVLVGLEPPVASGPGSFIDEVLGASGFVNALPQTGNLYPPISLETAAKARPAAVIYPEGEIPREAVDRFLGDLRRLQGSPVRALPVPADLLVRPGPRTADAVEILAGMRRKGERR